MHREWASTWTMSRLTSATRISIARSINIREMHNIYTCTWKLSGQHKYGTKGGKRKSERENNEVKRSKTLKDVKVIIINFIGTMPPLYTQPRMQSGHSSCPSLTTNFGPTNIYIYIGCMKMWRCEVCFGHFRILVHPHTQQTHRRFFGISEVEKKRVNG